MPIYEYVCKECLHEEELFFKSHASVKEPYECPECKSKEYYKKMSLSTFDVPGGSMYDGKRDWKKNLTTHQQADVLMDEKVNPY